MSYCCCSVTRVLTIMTALRAESDGTAQPDPNQPPSVRLPSKRTRSPSPSKQQKPSLLEIERAIGAGQFKDRNLSEKEENKTMFDSFLLNTMMEDDNDVQKKLRETGDWIIDRTENSSRSSGKQILTVLFAMIIPLGFVLLVASGIVPVPLSSPYLEDILS